MEKFESVTAVAVPILRANVDTDAIIPSREMKSASKTGLAEGLFANWRYLSIGSREPNPEFVLNQPAYRGAQILLGGENFGCGSSREHAVWALREYGFRAIIAPSFSPIFRNNCVRNGIVPVRLSADQIAELAQKVTTNPQEHRVTVDLVSRQVRAHDGTAYSFEIDAHAREMLLKGLDEIDLTLTNREAIAAFIQRDRELRPWIYLDSQETGASST